MRTSPLTQVRTRSRRARRPRPPCPLRVELLEDRSLLSVTFQALGFLGDPAPGSGGLSHSFDWEPGGLNSRGDVVFGSDLSPVPGDAAGADDIGEGVFYQDKHGQRTALARVGDTAPDGATYGPNFLGEISLNNSGDGVFSFERQPLPSPFIAGVNAGLYRFSGPNHTVTAALLPGTPAPGGGTFSGTVFRPTINEAGTIAFVGIIPTSIGPGASVGLGQGDFLLDKKGHITDIVRPGDPAPGGNTFDWAQNPSINNNGDVAFGAHITADPFIQFGATFPATLTQIFTAESVYFKDGQTGKIRAVAVQGGPAPGGKTFTYAFGPIVNNSGDIAFAGALPANPPGSGIDPVNNDNNIGVYLNHNGQNIAVAEPGDAMPGGGHLVSAGFFTLDLGLNDSGTVAFCATLDTSTGGIPDTGMYTWSGGKLTLVARTGTVIPGVGTISALLAPGEIGQHTPISGGEAFNNRGQIVFQATLTDGRCALLEATPTGEPMRAAALSPTDSTQQLTLEQVQPLLREALHRWQEAGVNTSSLGTINVQIGDLPDQYLGETISGTIWLSPNAAGWGWYVDPAPQSGTALVTPGHMDLLTVLTHEVGHVLGFDHDAGNDVMAPALSPGVRLLPDADAAGAPTLAAVTTSGPVLPAVVSSPSVSTGLPGVATILATSPVDQLSAALPGDSENPAEQSLGAAPITATSAGVPLSQPMPVLNDARHAAVLAASTDTLDAVFAERGQDAAQDPSVAELPEP
jgi:hypothetical protein